MKKISLGLLAMMILFLLSSPGNVTAAGNTVTATASYSNVIVDGEYEFFDAYSINDSNYFKLRDIAYVLSNTSKKFDISFDSKKNAINIVSGKTYRADGSEMKTQSGDYRTKATLSNVKVYLNGKEAKLTAYTIGNNNYFKLRDLGSLLDFYVGWEADKYAIVIETMFSYGQSNDSYLYKANVPLLDTQMNSISNWANVSELQQFSYKDEGLAYAYVKNKQLIIVTPRKEIKVELLYPRLGDVIADESGNFYIIWGKEGTASTQQTVFISKYTPDGKLVKSTGFVGKSIMGEDGNTKIPFNHGNVVSAIHDGVLMVNYARTMYNGHQSNNVVAVNISDMSPYQFESILWDENTPNIPYVSHSFNQSVIYSEKAQDFIFANHGDAYGRGFIVEKLKKEMYVDYEKGVYASKYPAHNIFQFYLPANANYDMYIVNKTFAQLGGLAETSKGVVLVGASAKSISGSAKSEKQNLFIQIFDPLAQEISSDMFVGGTKRSGATSLDINDNKNTPLTSVNDYGVIWLTNYTDKDVIAPQVVVADDRIVVLWTEKSNYKAKSYYMVLSSSGNVLTPKTSLGNLQLNSYEMPIYHNGLIQWAYVYDLKLRVASIKI